jgi:hypothetical protein
MKSQESFLETAGVRELGAVRGRDPGLLGRGVLHAGGFAVNPCELDTHPRFRRAVLQAVNETGFVPHDLRTGTYVRRRERAVNASAKAHGFSRTDLRAGLDLYLARVDAGVRYVLNRLHLVPGADLDADAKRVAEESGVYPNHVLRQARWALDPTSETVCEVCGEYRGERMIWSHYCPACGVPVCYPCVRDGRHKLYHESLQEQATEEDLERMARADRDDEYIEREIERRHQSQ